jgi:phosphatidylethanolamine-binding protein (PEBP) family uncharacterized protein
MKLKIKKSLRRKQRNTKRNTKRRQIKGGSINFSVTYASQLVTGQEFTKNNTQLRPQVKFSAAPNKLYTLVMWDPDVPPQAQPGYAHWIVINLQSQNDINTNQLLDYTGPAPPPNTGVHRYYFGIFEQQGHITPQQPSRQQFDIINFVKENKLVEASKVFMTISAPNI